MPPSLLRPPCRRPRRAAVAIAGLAAALLAWGCSSSSSSSAVALTGIFKIEQLQPTGGPAWTPLGTTHCVELGTDPAESIAILLTTDASAELAVGTASTPEWTLTPPLACVGTPQCGYIAVTVDTCSAGPVDGGSANDGACVADRAGRLVLLAAGTTISISMHSLAEPEGVHRFQVELLNSDGSVPVNATTNRPFTDEVVVDVEHHCGAPSVVGPDAGAPDATVPDAGTDASFDASLPPDAGAPDASTDGSADADAARPHDASTHD